MNAGSVAAHSVGMPGHAYTAVEAAIGGEPQRGDGAGRGRRTGEQRLAGRHRDRNLRQGAGRTEARVAKGFDGLEPLSPRCKPSATPACRADTASAVARLSSGLAGFVDGEDVGVGGGMPSGFTRPRAKGGRACTVER